MKQAEKHIVIIWSKGEDKRQEIIDDIQNSFTVLKQFRITWDKKYFFENLKRFYAHSLQKKSPDEVLEILHNKIAHCGDEPFTALVFEDYTPKFENRKTSNGMTVVNANVFDKKATYRAMLGGGHKIHASDSNYETNKDISLLFGCSAEEFATRYKENSSEIEYSNNIVGVPTYESMAQLFFVLNNTLSYVVLRNFEELPHTYFVNEHGDIDLLVADKNFVTYLTGAVAIFPNDHQRVYHELSIANEKVPFDFRFVGDGYYDAKWQLNLLNNRVLDSQGFYRPNPTDHFFSLLYHAYVQKRKVSDDYKITLEHIARGLNLPYSKSKSDDAVHQLLVGFMNSHGYSFTLPADSSVYFNKKFVEKIDSKALQNDDRKLISSTISRTSQKSYLTEVFETERGILKIANHPIGTNEVTFLTALKDTASVPTILEVKTYEDTTEVLMERIIGVPFSNLVVTPEFWTFKQLENFNIALFKILIELLEHNIIHRDIRPANILIVNTPNGFEPRLIDFGWAAALDDPNPITPAGLGHSYAYPGNGFSDAYSMGKCIQFLYRNLSYLSPLIKSLLSLTPEMNEDKLLLMQQLNELIEQQKNKTYTPAFKDRIALWVKKHRIQEKVTSILGEKNSKRLKKRFTKVF